VNRSQTALKKTPAPRTVTGHNRTQRKQMQFTKTRRESRVECNRDKRTIVAKALRTNDFTRCMRLTSAAHGDTRKSNELAPLLRDTVRVAAFAVERARRTAEAARILVTVRSKPPMDRPRRSSAPDDWRADFPPILVLLLHCLSFSTQELFEP
jgi:hypothetical protein